MIIFYVPICKMVTYIYNPWISGSKDTNGLDELFWTQRNYLGKSFENNFFVKSFDNWWNTLSYYSNHYWNNLCIYVNLV